MADRYSDQGDRIISTNPVLVSRYRLFTRVNHWTIALCVFILILSGLAMFWPMFFRLTALFGGGQTTRWLHPIVGVILAAGYFLIFVQLVARNLPRSEDVTWLLRIRDVLIQDEDRLPQLGKYNAGQKLVFWGMGALILVLLATGVMIWQQYFPDLVSIPARRIAVLAHSVAAVLMILAVIVHVYAAIWTRGTFSAMIRGYVTGGWAWRHHRKWLKEVAGRRD